MSALAATVRMRKWIDQWRCHERVFHPLGDGRVMLDDNLGGPFPITEADALQRIAELTARGWTPAEARQ